MNPAERETLRISLLKFLQCDGSAIFGLPTQRLLVLVKSEGYAITFSEVEAELGYLSDPEKGLVRQINKVLTSQNSWAITAKGRDLLEQLQSAE